MRLLCHRLSTSITQWPVILQVFNIILQPDESLGWHCNIKIQENKSSSPLSVINNQ